MTENNRQLLRISGMDNERTFTIPEGSVIIGRQAGVDIRLDHARVSRRHAVLQLKDGNVTITDLGSANGTRVNGEKLTPDIPVTLQTGDSIKIAVFFLVYEARAIPQVEALPEPEAQFEPEMQMEEKPVVESQPERMDETLQIQDLLFIQDQEPPQDPPAPPPIDPAVPNHGYTPPPGLSGHDSRYLDYLPDIYHTDFMARFLALFESIYAPVQWTAENFDLFLSPRTAPQDFLQWLANWYEITFDNSWSAEKKRMLLAEAHQIYARRGTKWALSRVLEIYLGHKPIITDQEFDELDPFTFIVQFSQGEGDVNRLLLEQIIDYHKPAHTNYQMKFAQ